MKITILGPFTAALNGRPVAPTAAKPRQVLAMLALHAGRVVSADALIDELWAERPPRSARTTLQTYVLQLRRRMAAALPGGDAGAVLVTAFGGYRLDVAAVDVDALRYQRLARDGQHAADAGDHDGAVRLLGAALAEWYGPALVDVPAGPTLGVEVTRLEESRLAAMESRIAAELHRGRHLAVLGELAQLSHRHPLHENLSALHITALSRAGRPTQALDAFRRLRSALVSELGIEPSAPLQRLHRAILAPGTQPDRQASAQDRFSSRLPSDVISSRLAV
ncbi:AfsR/SARP family transcriptional regulator [Pseudonocardia sp. GCM10023141]|uniref:AfsR/SARP family transcriptional regulator n=1 Tax=Pseudonocardia sp. GCM10023141 TaxID=3252653 RepID=UPI0036148D86